jgi:hypothetical protein
VLNRAVRRAAAFRSDFAALLSYAVIAVLYSWPLPTRFDTAFLGSPAADLGAYVWNLWVFRHEIVVRHSSPFFTSAILALTPPRAPLSLQNYTAFADVLALPLIPRLGIVVTFNLLSLFAVVLSAYAMFLYARGRTGDPWGAWIGGAAFGFSSFMMIRQTAHFSLVLAAPLPIFGLLMHRMSRRPSYRLAIASGGVVAWAFFCDPYYAVYCLLFLLYMVGYSAFTLDFLPSEYRSNWPGTIVDLGLFTVGGLIVAIALSGGRTFVLRGITVSATRLYTPMLVFSALLILRWAVTTRPRVSVLPMNWATARFTIVGMAAILVGLAPMLSAFTSPLGSPLAANPVPMWRSSSPGVDVLAYLIPNPLHPWASASWLAWLSERPNGAVENVASLPWVALLTIVCAWWMTRHRPHSGWMAFTAFFAVLSLGPFVKIGGIDTYLPTPWALLRYAPVIGAARMPTRLAVLTSLGISMLLAMAVQRLRQRSTRPHVVFAVVGALLLFELWPAPRLLADARVSPVFQTIADDPRPVRVLNLPFGLHDGLGGKGGQHSISQYQQTVHGKPLAGGYLSRLPPGAIKRYQRMPLMSVLLELSEGQPVDPERLDEAVARARDRRKELNIGWIVVDSSRATPELLALCNRAFDMQRIATDGDWVIYRAEP